MQSDSDVRLKDKLIASALTVIALMIAGGCTGGVGWAWALNKQLGVIEEKLNWLTEFRQDFKALQLKVDDQRHDFDLSLGRVGTVERKLRERGIPIPREKDTGVTE